MAFSVLRCPQRSVEWFAARAGRLTGSVAADMCAVIKSGEAAGRRNLRAKLVLERITGKSQDRAFQSQAMKDGIDREADARAAYQTLTGEFVDQTGFLIHDELMVGASLDGDLESFDRIVEIKCPLEATHLGYIRSGRVPAHYLTQVTHLLWLTGAKHCDWFSFHPDFPPALRMKLVRIERHEPDLAAYELILRQFLREVQDEVDEIAALAAKGV